MQTLQDLLGIELPIIQAPMAGVQGSALAIAVSHAGGVGSLPCAMLNADMMRREISSMQSASATPFNVNFFCHSPPAADERREAAWRRALAPYYREFGIDESAISTGPQRTPFGSEAAEILEELRPALVSFHFGLPPAELLARVRRTGARVLGCATTVAEARWLEARGADFIVAQGYEAGGHRGMFLSDDLNTQAGTFALLPQMVRAVKIPVIAAGGIASPAEVAAAFALGACGVQVGTTYMLCPEATTNPAHRAALQGDAAALTAITNLFSGRPARGIVNRLMRELGPIHAAAPEFPLAAVAINPLRAAAERKGSGDFSPMWCGQNATGCKNISAGALTRELMQRRAS